MKKNILIGIALLSAMLIGCSGQTTNEVANASETVTASTPSVQSVSNPEPAAQPKLAAMGLKEIEYDFGTIKQGEIVNHTFQFTNEGEIPLIITDIQTTCGCTTPQYTRTPVEPGKTGEIMVQFDSNGKTGVQDKIITVYSNVQGGSTNLRIKCVVEDISAMQGPLKKKS